MPRYAVDGRDRTGRQVKTVFKAESQDEAKRLAISKGILVYKISRSDAKADWNLIERDSKGNFKLNLTRPSVAPNELAVFTKQLSTMVDSGVALVQGLGILCDQTSNARLRQVLTGVRESVEKGKPLSEAMSQYADVFDKLYVSLVEAGGASGQLDQMLRKLSMYIEKSNKLRSQLKSALSYPTIVLVLALAMTILMLTVVVPMLAKNFTDSGKALPQLTQLVIDISDFFKSYILEIIATITAIYWGFSKWKSTPKGEMTWDAMMLKVPLFGQVILKISLARFASTMSTLTSSGIAILEALSVCAKASGNIIIESEIDRIKTDVSKGKSLGISMQKSPLFPAMITSMVTIGETTGRLDTMLEKVSYFYEEEVDSALAAALKMVEPLMFVIIGGIVGFILIAMYLPVFDLASTVSG